MTLIQLNTYLQKNLVLVIEVKDPDIAGLFLAGLPVLLYWENYKRQDNKSSL